MKVLYCWRCYQENPPDAERCQACSADLYAEPGQDYTDRLLWALKHPEPTVAPRAAWILGERREKRAVPALIEAAERLSDMGALEQIACALGKIGDESAIPILAKLLKNSYLTVRLAAAEALVNIGTPEARHALAQAAFDPSPAVREFVAKVSRV